MNQSLTGRATNAALTGRQNGKKQNMVAERRVCVSLFAFIFMALASLFVHDHENIPHRLTEQSQRCALYAGLKRRTCRNTTHYFTTRFGPHSDRAWRVNLESHSSVSRTSVRATLSLQTSQWIPKPSSFRHG